MTSHRKPPIWPKRLGICSWCNKPKAIRLKKNGTHSMVQASMHDDCTREYNMAMNLQSAVKTLRARDGNRCNVCHESNQCGAYEVDHVVPLWKVAHLPDEQRLEYFKLGNMQLLCPTGSPNNCHKRKSAKEAAERAHHKRLCGVTGQGPKRKIPSRPFPKPPADFQYRWCSSSTFIKRGGAA